MAVAKGERRRRKDNIPNDVPYNKLTRDQKLELDGIIQQTASYFSWRLCKMSAGVLDHDECKYDLLNHAYWVISENLEKTPPSKKRQNVVAYVRTAITNKHYDMLDDHFDGKMVNDQLGYKIARDLCADEEENGEGRLLRKEREAQAKIDAADYIDTITKSAALLGVKVDYNDWIVTALNVIAKGLNTKVLTGDLRKKMKAIRKQLAKSGYKTDLRKTVIEPRGVGLTKFIENFVGDDETITVADIVMALSRKNMVYNLGSVSSILSTYRRRKGLIVKGKPIEQHKSLRAIVRRILKSGIHDLIEIQDKLIEKGVVFKPSSVRTLLRELRKEEPELFDLGRGIYQA